MRRGFLLGELACGLAGLVGLAGAGGCGSDSSDGLGDIRDELGRLPGVSQVQELPSTVLGYRSFSFVVDQPEDHANPMGVRFGQRMTLLHRDYAAPTVIYNSGYFVTTPPRRSEVAILVGANQLAMEHRFFGPSRPDPPDWTTLTIAQAAADQHAVVQTFRSLYRGAWLSTGGSKGGMTSLFHRRFYPDDVDGTVAYVSPLDYASDAVIDPSNRFIQFLEQVGTDPACRDALTQFQVTALTGSMRDGLIALLPQAGSFQGILGEQRALEFAVEEMPFIFWQYGSQSDCAAIPPAGATASEYFGFLDGVVSLYTYSDADLTDYLPYYHQSATQLGYPIDDERAFADVLMYPAADQPPAYIPAGVPTPPYDGGAAMLDVQGWIHTAGSRLLLVYGQNDPWSAGAIDLAGARDSFRFFVPGGNHGSNLHGLSPADQSMALDAISRWAGVTAGFALQAVEPGAAEDEAMAEERRHRL
jgi:PS-10 peptidase S37